VALEPILETTVLCCLTPSLDNAFIMGIVPRGAGLVSGYERPTEDVPGCRAGSDEVGFTPGKELPGDKRASWGQESWLLRP
jgi:hypothetical protein